MQEISKKELLMLTGISYGQLYRWKRQGLIPEEWFQKRSSFTGQETFFPRELILERINKILELKENQSLDEIKDQFEDSMVKKTLTKDILRTLIQRTSLLDFVSEGEVGFGDGVLLLALNELDYIPDYMLWSCYQEHKALRTEIVDFDTLIFIPDGERLHYVLTTGTLKSSYDAKQVIQIKPLVEKLKMSLIG